MKRIMFMTNSMYGGGAEKVLQTLLKNLDREKYDIIVYSLHNEVINPYYYPSDIKYKVVFDKDRGSSVFGKYIGKIKGKLFQIAPSWLFYALFIHEKFDVEVAFIEGEATKIISGSTNRKSKKIAWVHIDLIANPWTDFLYKNVTDERNHYNKFDKIVCVSSGVKKAFIEKYNLEVE